jgi:hypothetical protein
LAGAFAQPAEYKWFMPSKGRNIREDSVHLPLNGDIASGFLVTSRAPIGGG